MIDGVRKGFFGASGCGKTYAAMKLLEKQKGLILIIDPKLEINAPRGQSATWFVGTNYRDIVKGLAERQAFCRYFVLKPNRIADAARLCQFVFERARANCTLFVDESQEVCPSGTARRDPENPLLKISRMGRSRGISLFVASQRLNAVDITLRSNINDLFLFRQSDFSDAETMRKMCGVDGRALKPREFVYMTDGGTVKRYPHIGSLLK